MKRFVRRVSMLATSRLSAEHRQAIKGLLKRYLPPRVRARLRRAAGRAGGPDRVAGRHHSIDNELERGLNKKVTSVSRALWMGFTADATADLERIRRTGSTTPRAAARAAESLARWYATNGEYEKALDRILHANALGTLVPRERFLVLEHHLLTELGLFEGAEQLYEASGKESPDLRLMHANLRLRQAEAGHLSRSDADRERLELIDWVYRKHSILPISDLIVGDRLSFSALDHDVVREPVHDESTAVVSIVVPAYNAEDTLATSVNSLRAQSHSNLEILIVDDASTDNTNAVAKDLASRDPRVRVIQHGQNSGAYAARNTGLASASGEYFTVHDADDWSHPQLIERQLPVLHENGAIGSFSRLARVTPDLKFLLRPYRPMLEPIHWNYTSLLVRTATLRELGGWDAVRAHSDSELIERLRSHYGTNALVEVDSSVPLSFFLVSGENLTENSSTTLRSVDFGLRKEYSEQARFWRAKTFTDAEPPSYVDHPRGGTKRPFYCGRALAQNRDQVSQTYDLVIGSDLALTGGTRRCNLAYIECARKLGLRVGVFNMPRYLLRGSGTIDPTYRELFELDEVDLLVPGDRVSGRTLLVHHPPVLRKKFESYPQVTAERHYMLVNQLPWAMKDYTDVQYDSAAARAHYRDAFGEEPIWIPISPRVRNYLGSELPTDLMHGEDWYPVVGWDPVIDGASGRQRASGPVVGRHSRDHETKWPELPEVLQSAYLAETQYKVELLGGTRAAESVLGYRPRNWTVHPFDSISVREFLQRIDFFVHYHHSMYIEEFGRNIAEAMAEGVVCILPPEYAETFSDAAVYAESDEVAEAVEALWSDQATYNEYASRGVEFVRRHCSPDVGMERIDSLLP